MIRWLADRVEAFLNWLAPTSILDVLDMEWADELAEWEAAHEVHEPPASAPKEESLHGGTGTGFPRPVPPTSTLPPGAGGLPDFRDRG